MSSEVLTIRVPSHIKTSLASLGKILHRSKSYIAERAIEEYLEQHAWQIPELQAAEQEIKQGVFVSEAKVNSYLSSWGTTNEQSAPKA